MTFDGTVGSLSDLYTTDPRSPYQRILKNTRNNYNSRLAQILQSCREEHVAGLTGPRLASLYEEWAMRGPTAAHASMTMLKSLLAFGGDFLNDRACQNAYLIAYRGSFRVVNGKVEVRLPEFATRNNSVQL